MAVHNVDTYDNREHLIRAHLIFLEMLQFVLLKYETCGLLDHVTDTSVGDRTAIN